MRSFESEKDFLENYNSRDYDAPLATVDLCIFSIINQSLKVLVVKRSEYPLKGRWALPGGIIDIEVDPDLEATALRKLEFKTGVKTPYVEQVETVGNRTRDPRGWSMTVLYLALLDHRHAKTGDAEEVCWVTLPEVNKMDLAFDHLQLINKAVERLRSKVSYSTLPMHILPIEFTLAELQKAYEIIMGRKVDKKAFRRRIETANLLDETGEMRQDGGRPAKLYKIRKNSETHFYNRSI